MKICFLAGANSIHSHKWINFFSNMGHEVIWISLSPTSNKISDDIKYYEFTSGIFSSIYKVRKLILKLNPDIVHIHGMWRPIHFFFILHCTFLNIPILVQPHGMLLVEALKSKSFLSYLIKKVTLFFYSKFFSSLKEDR